MSKIKITPLEQHYLDASKVGDFDAFISLIKKETKTFRSDKLLRECLNNACEGGHKRIVVAILKCREITNYPLPIDGRNWAQHSYYALYYAFKGGDTNMINMIAWRTFSYNKHQLSKKQIWEYGLLGACETNRINIFEAYVNNVSCTPDFLNECLKNACLSDDNLDMINYLINKGATCWNGGLLYACKKGCIQNVKLMISYGANNWNDALHEACFTGHAEIAELMIERGGKSTTENLYNACYHGLIKIVKYMYTICKCICYGVCLYYACKGNHMEVVKFLLSYVSDYFNHGLEGACAGGHLEIVELMIQKGATNLNMGLHAACVYDQTEVAKVMLTAGAFDPDGRCLRTCCFSNNLDIIKILAVHETINWDEGLLALCLHGNDESVRFILDNFPKAPNTPVTAATITKLNLALDRAANNTTNNTQNIVNIINLLLQKGANNLKCIKGITDFKLYCVYLNYLKIVPKKSDGNYLKYLKQYPPYVLFIGCKLTKLNKSCCIKKLPTELFKLLSEY